SDSGGTKRRATPANVFNHHRSDEGLHFVCPWATDKVECAARRKRHDESNWLGWVGLRPCDAGEDWQYGHARGQTHESSAIENFQPTTLQIALHANTRRATNVPFNLTMLPCR